MKTKKALELLSNGNIIYEDGPVGPLTKYADRYLQSYKDREDSIQHNKVSPRVASALLNNLKRKIGTELSQCQHDLPIAMTFDVYQGIKHLASTTNDRGLVHLAKHLKSVWSNDPMGSLSYGNLTNLIAHYHQNYPKSKISKNVNAVLNKVGYNKLPVAKLTQMAAQINSQSDYEDLVFSAGLSGDRPDQIKSRTLLRDLVALRNININSKVNNNDDRSTIERISDKVAQEIFDGVEDEDVDLMGPSVVETDDHQSTEITPVESEPVTEQEMDTMVPLINEVEEFVEESAPPEAEQYIETEREEDGSTPGTAEWGFNEALEGHQYPPPSKGWQDEELSEHGIDVDDESVVEEHFAMKEAKFVLPINKVGVAPPGWENTIKQMKKHPSKIDNPWALAWYMKDKGYKPSKSSKKTAQYDPVDEEDLLEDVDNEQSKGLPTLEDLDKRYYEKKKQMEQSKNVGDKYGMNLTAEQVEAAIIDRGEIYKIGQVSIHVNDQDEVELWVRDQGRSAALHNLDVVIKDFMKAVNAELHPDLNKSGSYYIVNLLPVPCSKCASISYFEPVSDQNGLYACSCGNFTKSASIDSLIKCRQLQAGHILHINLPNYITDANIAANSILTKQLGPLHISASLDSVNNNQIEFWIDNIKPGILRKISESLNNLGFILVHKNAQINPAYTKAPGTSDINIAPDIEPQITNLKDVKTTMPETGNSPDIAASFAHYKSTGLGFLDSVAQFRKDFPDWVKEHNTPELDAQLIQIGEQLYTNVVTACMNPKVNEQQPDQTKVPKDVLKNKKTLIKSATISHENGKWVVKTKDGKRILGKHDTKEDAQKQLSAIEISKHGQMDPKVNEQQPDQTKVPKKVLGPGSDSGDGHTNNLKQPTIIKQHPAKNKSPTDMGSTNEDKDPGTFGASKPSKTGTQPGAGSQPGTKAPSTNLGKDSDSDTKKTIPTPNKFGPRPAI
jgi:hypothetical protein